MLSGHGGRQRGSAQSVKPLFGRCICKQVPNDDPFYRFDLASREARVLWTLRVAIEEGGIRKMEGMVQMGVRCMSN